MARKMCLSELDAASRLRFRFFRFWWFRSRRAARAASTSAHARRNRSAIGTSSSANWSLHRSAAEVLSPDLFARHRWIEAAGEGDDDDG